MNCNLQTNNVLKNAYTNLRSFDVMCHICDVDFIVLFI